MSNTANFASRSATSGEGTFFGELDRSDRLDDRRGSLNDLKRGMRQQGLVIFALIFKDFRARSSSGRFGLLWTVLRPIVRVGMIAGLWYLIGKNEISDVPIYLVITAAIATYFMVIHSLSSIPGAMTSNQNLYGYRQVKPIDALLARYILDNLLLLFSGALMLFGFWWFLSEAPQFPDPLMMIAVLGLTILLTLGISLLAGVYSMLYDDAGRILQMLRRPLILLSGVMHTQDQLPETARYILSWNPVAQISEHMRAYMLGMPLSPEADLTYTAIACILFLAWGLITYYTNRIRILQG